MDGIFFFLSFSLNLPWLVGLRHRILASAREGICSSSVLQAEKQILFTDFNPLCMLAGLGRLARRWWGRDSAGKGLALNTRGEDGEQRPEPSVAQWCSVASWWSCLQLPGSWAGKGPSRGIHGAMEG